MAVQSYNEEEKQRCNEPKISEGRHEQGRPQERRPIPLRVARTASLEEQP